MQLRTDLALERHESLPTEIEGVTLEQYRTSDLRISALSVKTPTAAEKLGKPMGHYITMEGFDLTDSFMHIEEKVTVIAEQLQKLLPQDENILVVGLGNEQITPDALGVKSVRHILATRHLQGEIARSTGLTQMRSVSVLTTGVLGQTGIEAGDVVLSVVRAIRPTAVIVIDALAARNLSRLGTTVQLSDCGITPGSGVGNHRMTLNRETLGIPVLSVGIPTIVDALTLAQDIAQSDVIPESLRLQAKAMVVTPGEIDLLVERAAFLVGMAVNCAIQKDFTFEELSTLVS